VQVQADQVHPHVNEVSRQADAHVGVADALQALEIALVKRTLQQGQQPLLVLPPQPGQLSLILQKFGRVGDGKEQVVEIRDDRVGVGRNHGQQAL